MQLVTSHHCITSVWIRWESYSKTTCCWSQAFRQPEEPAEICSHSAPRAWVRLIYGSELWLTVHAPIHHRVVGWGRGQDSVRVSQVLFSPKLKKRKRKEKTTCVGLAVKRASSQKPKANITACCSIMISLKWNQEARHMRNSNPNYLYSILWLYSVLRRKTHRYTQ